MKSYEFIGPLRPWERRGDALRKQRAANRSRVKTLSPRQSLGRYRAAAFAGLFSDRVPYPTDVERPRTRRDCLPGGCNEARPCPFVTCKYNLLVDVDPRTGSLKINHPLAALDEPRESCALDVADRGGMSLDEIGHLLDLSRERVNQIEERALTLLRRPAAAL